MKYILQKTTQKLQSPAILKTQNIDYQSKPLQLFTAKSRSHEKNTKLNHIIIISYKYWFRQFLCNFYHKNA